MSDSSISLGLDAIFSNIDNKDDTHNSASELAIDLIRKSPYQARKIFSLNEISELSDSIKQHGILQPLLVRQTDDGIELVAGERRLRAAKQINMKSVPVIWCNVTDETASAFGLIENIQRKNLNVLEEAEAYKRLIDDYGLSHDELSHKVAKSRSHITNLLRLTKLHPSVKSYLMSDEITMGHARALLALAIDEQQLACEHVIENGLTVRETEKYVQSLLLEDSNSVRNNMPTLDDSFHEKINVWENRITCLIDSKSKITFDKKGRAKLTIYADTEDDLERIIKLMDK